jgi:RecB family exonuclease
LITAWSWSRLEVFEKCPYQAYLKFYEKRPEPENPRRDAALSRGTLLHEAAEAYIRGELKDADMSPFKRVMADLDKSRDLFAQGRARVEEEWAFDVEWQRTDWSAPTTWLRVKTDVCQEPTDDLTVGEVIDWKSGKKEGNEIKHIQQGQLYAATAFVWQPQYDVVSVKFRYVDHSEKLDRTYTRAQGAQFLDAFTKRAKRMTEAEVFPAKPNKINCKYCPYGVANGDGSCLHAAVP